MSNLEQTFIPTSITPATEYIQEVVGVFSSAEDLQDTIRDLEGTAFPRQDISVMGSRDELVEAFGEKTVNPLMAMDDDSTPREAPARPEEETIGAAALVGIPAYVGAMGLALASGAVAFPAIIGAAIIGGIGGGSVGVVLNKLFGTRATRHIEEQIQKGGLLLWVRAPDEKRQSLAMQIMRNHNAHDVHVADF